MKQFLLWIKHQTITNLLFYIFVFCIPFQSRIIFNTDDAYIGSMFSYHKAIFLYGTDILFVLLLAVHTIFYKDRKVSKLLSARKWLILAIFTGITSAFHVQQWDLYWFYLAKLIQFWLIVDLVRITSISKYNILSTIITSGTIQAIIAIFQFHVQQGVNLGFLGEYVPNIADLGAATLRIGDQIILRPYGTFPHPNVLGGFLAISMVSWLWVSRETKRLILRIVLIISGVLILWGLALTFSRSAWLGAFLGVISLIAIFTYRHGIKSVLFPVILLIVSCATLFCSYKYAFSPRLAESGVHSPAANYRSMFNKDGLQIWLENPLTGTGLGNYITQHELSFHVEQWQHQPPHNVFLYLLAQLGIIGLLITIFSYYKLGFTWNNMNNALNLGLLATILPLAMFDHYLVSIQQGILLFGVIIAILIKQDVSQVVKHPIEDVR